MVGRQDYKRTISITILFLMKLSYSLYVRGEEKVVDTQATNQPTLILTLTLTLTLVP
jgi:hypothetical protein